MHEDDQSHASLVCGHGGQNNTQKTGEHALSSLLWRHFVRGRTCVDTPFSTLSLRRSLVFRTFCQVGAGGLDAAVATGTIIGLYDDGDAEGCLLDYDIDDAVLQV